MAFRGDQWNCLESEQHGDAPLCDVGQVYHTVSRSVPVSFRPSKIEHSETGGTAVTMSTAVAVVKLPWVVTLHSLIMGRRFWPTPPETKLQFDCGAF